MANAPSKGLERDGALDRLSELFDDQHDRIYRLARRLSRDPEAARDLVQETFLRAARKVRSLPAERPAAEAWLVRTTVNLCRDRGRRRAVRDRDRHHLPGPAPVGSDPEGSAVARASVEAALLTLAPKRRAVVVMAELEGLPTPEIARLLGCREGTVRWHLSRGRHELRRWMTEGAGSRSTPGRRPRGAEPANPLPSSEPSARRTGARSPSDEETP